MSILTNENRIGNFSSSNIYKLLTTDRSGKGFGKPALTYIEEVNMERELGMSIHTESDARPLQWGKMCEKIVHEKLPLQYTLTSDITISHPQYDFWVGSPDGTTPDALTEIKCPLTKKSWFKLVAGENIYSMMDGFSRSGAQYTEHTDGEKYYWQTISNAILTGKKFAELIIFIPLATDLLSIKEEGEFLGYNWIKYADPDDLPHLMDESKFKSITKMRFEVPQKDIDLLTSKVIEASAMLIPRQSFTTSIAA